MIDYEYAEKCPLCGGEGKYFKEGGDVGEIVHLDKCQECGVAYQNPRMTRESVDEYYSNGNYHAKHTSPLWAEITRANYYKNLLNGMEILPYRCLDIGCGRGYLLHNLKDYFGTEIVGVEKRTLPGSVFKKAVKDKKQVKGKFDLIICIQTLEHLYDPQEELRWMADHITLSGTIIVDLPVDGKIYLPHVFVFDILSAKLMLNRLGLKYLHLETKKDTALFLIGEQYGEMRSEIIVETLGKAMVKDGVYS